MLRRQTYELGSTHSFPQRDEAVSLIGSSTLPLDLRDWFADEILREWIQEEVFRLDWQHPLVQEHLKHHPDFRPQVLLTLLSYGCATQSFTSKEIISRCRLEKPLYEICEAKVPFPNELSAFRRRNRRLIIKVLAAVFSRALKRRFQLWADLLPPGLEKAMEDRANARVDVARHMDSGGDD